MSMKDIPLGDTEDALKSGDPGQAIAREEVSRHLDGIVKVLIESGVTEFSVKHTVGGETRKSGKQVEYIYRFTGELLSAKVEE